MFFYYHLSAKEVCVRVYIHTCMHTYIHTCIERERERERELY